MAGTNGDSASPSRADGAARRAPAQQHAAAPQAGAAAAPKRKRMTPMGHALMALSLATAVVAVFWPQLAPHLTELARAAAPKVARAGGEGGAGKACPLVRRRGLPACGRMRQRRAMRPSRSGIDATAWGRHGAAQRPASQLELGSAFPPKRASPTHTRPQSAQGYTSASGTPLPAGHPPINGAAAPAAAAAASPAAAAPRGAAPRRLIWIRAAEIWTADERAPRARAMAVDAGSGEVVRVGGEPEAGSSYDVIDFGDAFVMPVRTPCMAVVHMRMHGVCLHAHGVRVHGEHGHKGRIRRACHCARWPACCWNSIERPRSLHGTAWDAVASRCTGSHAATAIKPRTPVSFPCAQLRSRLPGHCRFPRALHTRCAALRAHGCARHAFPVWLQIACMGAHWLKPAAWHACLAYVHGLRGRLLVAAGCSAAPLSVA